ncbi:hypothetical protein [Promicromonospora sukumoe]
MSARYRAATAVIAVALVAGCAGVDVDRLPGTYSEPGGDAEIQLDEDGTFVASEVPGTAIARSLDDDVLDFAGTWEFVDSRSSTDFVYLTVEDGSAGSFTGIQMYVDGPDEVSFWADPDGPPSLTLER